MPSQASLTLHPCFLSPLFFPSSPLPPPGTWPLRSPASASLSRSTSPWLTRPLGGTSPTASRAPRPRATTSWAASWAGPQAATDREGEARRRVSHGGAAGLRGCVGRRHALAICSRLPLSFFSRKPTPRLCVHVHFLPLSPSASHACSSLGPKPLPRHHPLLPEQARGLVSLAIPPERCRAARRGRGRVQPGQRDRCDAAGPGRDRLRHSAADARRGRAGGAQPGELSKGTGV
jgi:hypothetical protein